MINVVEKGKKVNLKPVQTTMREFAEDVIYAINEQLKEKENEKSINEKRYIYLDKIQPFGKPEWLASIIEALVNKGHIFKVVTNEQNFYMLQL